MLSTDPSYDIQDHCQHPQNANPDVFYAWGCVRTKFPATVMDLGVVSSEGHIMPPHIFEVGLNSQTPKCYLDVLQEMWWSPDAIRWPVADPGCGSRTRYQPTKSKETQAWLQKECYDLVSFSHWPLSSPDTEPAGLLRLVIRREHHLTWPRNNTISQPDRRHPSSISRAPAGVWWKRHAPSSGSISRRWLRLKAATLNRCQLLLHNQVTWIDFFI